MSNYPDGYQDEYEKQCEANDRIDTILDESAKSMILSADKWAIADAFDGEDDPVQCAEDYLATKKYQQRVLDYFRELAEMEYGL